MFYLSGLNESFRVMKLVVVFSLYYAAQRWRYGAVADLRVISFPTEREIGRESAAAKSTTPAIAYTACCAA